MKAGLISVALEAVARAALEAAEKAASAFEKRALKERSGVFWKGTMDAEGAF